MSRQWFLCVSILALIALQPTSMKDGPSPLEAAKPTDPPGVDDCSSPPDDDFPIENAVAGGGRVTVHVMLKGRRSLPPSPTSAEEQAFLAEVEVARRDFRSRTAGRGVRIVREHRHTRGAIVEIDAAGLETLTRDPEVERVYRPIPLAPSVIEGNALIHADAVNSCGISGDGVTVAILDTGVDYHHPGLGPCDEVGLGCKVVAGYDFGDGDGDPLDAVGHGTSVAGIVAGNPVAGSATGVAPNAELVALKVFDAAGLSSTAYVDPALQWVLDHHNDPVLNLNIKAVNMSLGTNSTYSDSTACPCSGTTTADLIASLQSLGIAVVVASGNRGVHDGVSFPACALGAIAVGAVYDASVGPKTTCILPGPANCIASCTDDPTAADKFACFTNAGFPLDFLAPSWRATTIALGGGTRDFSGTSAATPYIAGAFALMFEVQPSQNLTDLRGRLSDTGINIEDPLGWTCDPEDPRCRNPRRPSYIRIDVEAALDSFADNDRRISCLDNCPTTYNPDQNFVGDPFVQVLSPNGGNFLYINSQVNLLWSATDVCGGVSSVDVLLSRTGPLGPFMLIAGPISNSGSYTWLVTGPVTTDARLKVIARDPAGNTASDLSNTSFTILPSCGPASPTSWCREEGTRCTWNGTCGGNGCFNYSCSYDASCTYFDDCPSNACRC